MWRQERKEGSKETEDNRRTMERKRRWKINRRKDRYVCVCVGMLQRKKFTHLTS